MAPTPAQALEGVSLAGKNKTVVIIGATLGVGAAVARKFARLGCERIIILGRNETRGNQVLEQLRELAPQKVDASFVRADIGTVRGMRQAAKDIQAATGSSGIDYLIMCQNGVPTGTIVETGDGHEKGFAVQTLSRFALSYLLTTSNALSPGATVLFVANAGISLNDLDVEDLSLKRRAKAGRTKLFLFFDQSKRDSSVLDAVALHLQKRFPQYRYCHMHPGLVRSEEFDGNNFPFPMNWGASLGLKVIGQTTTQIADVPVYIAINPSTPIDLKDNKLFDHKLQPCPPGQWAQNESNREAVFVKLKELIGES